MNDKLVLIVDDDPKIRLLLQLAVEKLFGVRTAVAVDGEQGLRLVHELKPSLVLLDLDMPKLNGLEVVRRMRADEATRAIPVIMLTASRDAREEALAAGCSDFSPKPFTLKHLASMICAHLTPPAMLLQIV